MRAAPPIGGSIGSWAWRAWLPLWLCAAALAGCRPAPPRAPTVGIGRGERKEAVVERYLALGDSYTIGEGVAAPERFPEQLCAALRQGGRKLDAPRIVARTGWTTDELAAAIAADPPLGTFDFVTLLIGVNDQYQRRAPEDYRPRFRSLLRQAIGFAGGDARRVIVVSIPDWCVTPFAAAQGRADEGARIDAFNAVNRAEAAAVGAAYADVTAISRRAAADRSLLAADGLHPSGKMYALWIAAILSVVPPQ